MPFQNDILAGSGGQGGGYDIEKSLRFNDNDNFYLNRFGIASTATSNDIGTVSFWLKKSEMDGGQGIFSNHSDASNRTYIVFDAGSLQIFGKIGGSINMSLVTDRKFRDPASWYHFVIAIDVTQATAANRVKVYVNGSQITDFSTETYPAQNTDLPLFSKSNMIVGAQYATSLTDYMDGYLAEFYYIDGTALLPSDFGELSPVTNQWLAIDAVDALTFGNNGFYQKYGDGDNPQDFADTSSNAYTLGKTTAVMTTATKKAGNASIYLDGSNYFKTPSSGPNSFVASGWHGTRPEGNTIEMWVYPLAGSSGRLVDNSVDSENVFYIHLETNNTVTLYWRNYGSGGSNTGIYSHATTGTLDDNTWTHLAINWVGVTGSNPDVGNIMRFYIDGVQDSTTGGSGTSGGKVPWSMFTEPLYHGASNAAAPIGSVYLDQIRWSTAERYPDGTSFTPPTSAFVDDADTAFLIQPVFSGGQGADSSGNANNFNLNGIRPDLDASNSIIDTPQNSTGGNWCTMNPLDCQANVTFEDGSLVVNTGSNSGGCRGTMFTPPTGKWFWEFYMESLAGGASVGAGGSEGYPIAGAGVASDSYGYWQTDGKKINNNSQVTYGATYGGGDTIGVALDLDASPGTITFYKNGVSQGVAYSNLTDGMVYAPATGDQSGNSSVIVLNCGQDSTYVGNGPGADNQDANEIGSFRYAVPSGHLALCTDNLPSPEIALPGSSFNTHLYTGNNTASNAQTGIGFQPDFVWLKETSGTAFYGMFDSVRGPRSGISSNDDMAASTSTVGEDLASFDSDGFTVGEVDLWNSTNKNSAAITSWCWKAGGAPTADNSAGVGNTPTAGSVKINGANLGSALAGTIAATRISANTSAGFSIVQYVGNSTSGATVAHGLSEAPELMFVKDIGATYDWPVYAKPIDNDKYLLLNENDAKVTDSGRWNDTTPSASVFTLGDDGIVNDVGNTKIVYCFHSVPGYSRVGSYKGNGLAEGPFIYFGFKPAFIIVKNVTSAFYSTQASRWMEWDNKRSSYSGFSGNYNTDNLWLNETSAQSSSGGHKIDLVSNGLKQRSEGGSQNESTQTYLYYAVAASPFKTSNAR